MKAEVKALQEELAFLLRHHGKATRIRTLVKTNSIPLVNDLKFLDIPLQRVISPDVKANGPASLEQLFDIYLWPFVDPEEESDPIEGLRAENDALATFVEVGGSLQERVTRLLYALGNANGAELVFGANSVHVIAGDKTFGINDGVVQSRFCKGFEVGKFDPRLYLTSRRPLSIRNRVFGSLYREACRHDAGEALIALYLGQPDYDFRDLARMAQTFFVPTKSRIGKWENTILKSPDPLVTLYKNMVPEWMNKSTFTKRFGIPGKRPTVYTSSARLALLSKLHEHFYKTNKKEDL